MFALETEDLESDQYVCVKDKIIPNTLAFNVQDKGNNGVCKGDKNG
jgi:hypothetical protein